MKPDELFAPLLAWYDRHRRELPWRAPLGQRACAYHVLVSELMLQQTTVATVQPRFRAFIRRFPTLDALARAPLDDVLHEWQGLGYYRRARSLHATARVVVAQHGGQLPADPEALAALPGIGPYTAAAVAAIAHDRAVLALDGNVERVLARLFAVATPLPAARGELLRLAGDLAPTTRAGDTVQALMELGALVCRPRAPTCLVCPLRASCRAHALGLAAELPRKEAKRRRTRLFAVAFHLERADGAVLFRRRPDTGLLAGLVELPSTAWIERPPTSAEVGAAAPAAADWRPLGGAVRHVFTHRELAIEVRTARLEGMATVAGERGFWCTREALSTLALPTLTRKVLGHVAATR